MLHEIFKGTDNASEAINDNFNKLTWEYGSNDRGEWIFHVKSGWQVVKQSKEIETGKQTNFTEAIVPFKEIFSVILTPSADASYDNFKDMTVMAGAVKQGDNQIAVHKSTSTYLSTQNFDINVLLIGKREQ